MVVAMHAWTVTALQHQPANPIRLGAAGVDVFFVISGFIMATVSQGKTASAFLRDRLWRIYPIWWIAVLPWIFTYPPTWQQLAASVTLWPSYPNFTYPALPVGWTLSFEMLFYLSVALSLKTRPWVPLSLFASALVLRQLSHHPLFDFIGNPMIFEFLFGVCIAKMPKHERFAPLVLIVGLIGFALSPLSLFNSGVATIAATSLYRALFWGVPAALVVYSIVCLESRWRWPAIAVAVGDGSYSIYLFHSYFITFANLYWLAEFFLAISLGLAVHAFVERPILQARKRLRGAGARAAAVVKLSQGASASPASIGVPSNSQAF
jgi:exopolysaccharide production protein ExoZ